MNIPTPYALPSNDLAFLARSWQSCMHGLGFDADGPGSQLAYQRCLQAYQEPQRAYHTLQHLVECLYLFEANRALAQRPHDVCYALWYHDVVYDVHAHDNEQRSAEVAVEFLREQGCPVEEQRNVHQLILVTQHNSVVSAPDELLLCDIDLAILGASTSRYNEYARQVREEYAFVPSALFASKRIELLERFLGRQHLYSTPYFIELFEQQARANIAAEISDLISGLV
ncbi:MAG: N-methyl-D-aspartate receptor NMDAR2C subunit [Bacteroidetes bacterium]|nr:N-methyl-D-aspartate receptor NMDAR2C subunit [Bacteroidota bacterium]